MKKVLRVILGLFIFKAFVDLTPDKPSTPPTATAKPVKSPEALKEEAERGMAALVAQQLKKGSKNPDAFKLESLVVYDGGNACYEFRGTNSFNAIVPGRVVFLAKTREVVQEIPAEKFRKAWNSVCTKTGGKEISAAVRMYIL